MTGTWVVVLRCSCGVQWQREVGAERVAAAADGEALANEALRLEGESHRHGDGEYGLMRAVELRRVE